MPLDSSRNTSGRRRPGGQSGKSPEPRPRSKAGKRSPIVRVLVWMVGLGLLGMLAGAAVVAVVIATIYPRLPNVTSLTDYTPILPLRVYTAEGALIGEYGEERRQLVPIQEIPQVMKDAILSAEDARFFEHNGVDYRGLVRAALANIRDPRSQGASTITMQVARNIYLNPERTFTRKIYEILLTFKLEHALTKDQILEIYMNQIYLGNRAYGFAAASQAYYGIPLKNIDIAQAAMLAGLPIAPSQYNPIRRPERARMRQLYIIGRMEDNGFITAQQAEEARNEKLVIRRHTITYPVHAEFVAEMVRQVMFDRYGPSAYTRGLNVYTTIQASDQDVAYKALRTGLMNYEKRQHYRGPEAFVDLPADLAEREDVIDKALSAHPDNGDILSAVVLEASPQKVVVVRADGQQYDITGDGLKPVQSGLAAKAPAKIKIRPGAVVRIMEMPKNGWELTQLPEVEGAFVAMQPDTGEIRALVGGFDFNKSQFNHVTQAWRQPGSAFKPFIFSAAVAKGFSPGTLIADTPMYFTAEETGSKPWEPRNYDRKFEGMITMRTALARSRNITAIRLVQAIGPKNVRAWAGKFGFDVNRIQAVLPMALGTGDVTPLQMAAAYSVFANGGHLVDPWIIERVTDSRGNILSQTHPKPLNETPQVIDPRNAFLVDSMLRQVMLTGTGARAQAALKRPDIYGKTGTTNDFMDAWFAGFQPSLTAVTWVGYDNPRSLGRGETGGRLGLPIWVEFMRHALADIPVQEEKPPPGVTRASGDWTYDEFSNGRGVSSLGMNTIGNTDSSSVTAPTPEERKAIMDLFRN